MKTIDCSGAIFRIKSKAGADALIEWKCLEGTVELSRTGKSSIKSKQTFCGTKKTKGIKEFGSGTLVAEMDGDVSPAQELLKNADENTGDFLNDNHMLLEIEFNNSLGTNGTKLATEILVTEYKYILNPDDKVSISVEYEQDAPVVETPAA